MLQKELIKRLKGKYETNMDDKRWLNVSSDGIPLCRVKYNGKDVPRDTDTAMYYLQLAAEHGNQYAAQLLHSIRVNGNWTAALASLRLLGHMARIIQNRLEDERRGREHSVDRKLRRKIEEKKQAHGLKQ